MISNSNQAAPADNSVATRYGGTKKSRVSKKTGRVIAIIAVLSAILVACWFAFSASSNLLSYESVGYKIHDESTAWVEFELTKEPEETVACTVRVLTENAAIAGYRTVVIGPDKSTEQDHKDLTKYYTTDLRTDQLGSSGELETCWYVEEEEAPGISNLRDY